MIWTLKYNLLRKVFHTTQQHIHDRYIHNLLGIKLKQTSKCFLLEQIAKTLLFPMIMGKNNYSAGKRDRGKKTPPAPEGEAPRLHWTGGEASCLMESCIKNGFNVSWKLASAVIHDYVNSENQVSRKPTSRWIFNFMLHTFCLQHISSRHAKAQVSIIYGIPVVTS